MNSKVNVAVDKVIEIMDGGRNKIAAVDLVSENLKLTSEESAAVVRKVNRIMEVGDEPTNMGE
jgi:hypothetical protein